MVAVEAEQKVSHPGHGDAKVMHFMRAIEGISLEEFFSRWELAHNRIIEDVPEVGRHLRQCIHNRCIDDANELLAYFQTDVSKIHEGVASIWFENATSIENFRAYEAELLKINSETEHRFYDPAESFFVHARESLVLG
jgi:hypothetical protein